MRRIAIITTAACMSFGGMSYAQNQPASNQPTVGQEIKNAASETGDAIKTAAEKTGEAAKDAANKVSDTFKPDAENVKRTLQTATEAAVTKKGYDDLIERFSSVDRDRIGKVMPSDEQQKTLDGRIDQIQKAWKAKYNQDFAIKDREVVFDSRYLITPGTGVMADQARTASDRPANPNMNNADHGDMNAADKATDTKTALVVIPASHDLPDLNVSFTHEISGWKIDVPDNVTGMQLYTNLINQLTAVGESVDQWPADVNDAYRLVNHRLMLAVLDKQLMTTGANTPMTPITP